MRAPDPDEARLMRAVAAVFALAMLGLAAAHAQAPAATLPNMVSISDRIVTSGQPSGPALGALGAQGFGAVINLAPPAAANSVRDETGILERQSIVYINIPVELDNPTQLDFDTFVGAMAAMGTRKALVHCDTNMRSSAFVFLYRTIIQKEASGVAYEAVKKVWSPTPKWKHFMSQQLRTHGVAFDPL